MPHNQRNEAAEGEQAGKKPRRVLGVANRQLTAKEMKDILAGRRPIRAPRSLDQEPPTGLGPTPQASIPETNRFLREAAAAEGVDVSASIAGFAALNPAELTTAAQRRVTFQQRAESAIRSVAGETASVVGPAIAQVGGRVAPIARVARAAGRVAITAGSKLARIKLRRRRLNKSPETP